MKKRNKIHISCIQALILLSIICLPLFASFTSAHSPAWQVPTYSYVHVAPNPVGIGQTVSVVFWINAVPPTAAGNAGDRWTFYLDITDPKGTNKTLGPFISDPVGGSFTAFTPDQTGTYTITCRFPGQVVTGSTGTGLFYDNIAINDTYLASSSSTTLTVQEEQIPQPPTYPLPTEYWTRPIEGQNDQWYQIASSWLRGSQLIGGGVFQPYGIGPNSAHIMWTKPLEDGGIVGGNYTASEGMTFYDGSAYEGKGRNPLIVNGRLYYGLPRSSVPSGNGYVCVDLHTGQKIYWQNMTLPTFAQLYDYESMNQHGVIPNGYLWSTSGTTWMAYDSIDGNWLFNETDVPTGTEVYTQNGEIVRYVINVQGKWVGLWNNTAAHDLTGSTNPTDYYSTSYNQWRPVGKNVNASAAYSWNVSAPWLPSGATTLFVIHDDVLLGRNGSLPSVGSSWTPYTLWAMSLKPGSRGQLLWMKNYDAPAGNLSRSIRQVDPVNHVFIAYDQQVMQWSGYSLDDGRWLWTTPSEEALNFYSLTTGAFGVGGFGVAYGKLYSTGYSGIVYCYDTKTGNQLWNYTANAGLMDPSGAYSLLIGAITDGKIYLSSYEHSANAPHWKGSQLYCLNATTGKEVFTVDGWYADYSTAVADGFLVALNDYTLQYFCFGKGPSQLTVMSQSDQIALGNHVLLKGTVTDIAAGTRQTEQAGRFPNGVPAVSDESMSAWMEYVYMQKPRPSDVTGVTINLSVIDGNGNLRPIGSTVSDANGFYSYDWQPDIAGKYTVIASFEGSNSYWPSQAETAFAVYETAPTATTIAQPVSIADAYFIPVTAAIFVLLAIILVVLGVLLLKKRP
ncbi:MAG: PQQ-binding-like beta-propeller repeat protein [Candidatus Bathyarchaeota archaeon]|nr:PQQ-binding-like beta-propeller repeat protein [Candidatus Bathyarchaeota archaeon]